MDLSRRNFIKNAFISIGALTIGGVVDIVPKLTSDVVAVPEVKEIRVGGGGDSITWLSLAKEDLIRRLNVEVTTREEIRVSTTRELTLTLPPSEFMRSIKVNAWDWDRYNIVHDKGWVRVGSNEFMSTHYYNPRYLDALKRIDPNETKIIKIYRQLYGYENPLLTLAEEKDRKSVKDPSLWWFDERILSAPFQRLTTA